MSFSHLHSAREKANRSFVSVPPKDESRLETSSGVDDHSNAVAESNNTALDDNELYNLPSFVEIKSTPSMGRGLFATQQISEGQVIIDTKPHVACLSTQNLPFFCGACFSQAPVDKELQRCTKCKALHYCGPTCQTTDWAVHKFECQALRRWSKSAPSREHAIPNDAIRCLGRILWRRRIEGEESNWTKEIDQLQSHRMNLPPSAAEMHTHLAHAIVNYLGASSPADLTDYGISRVSDLVDVISRFISNTFAIATSSLTPLGASVSPPIALTNHSCDPNAVIVFPHVSRNPAKDEPAMKLVAIKSITPGDQILTSYIDTTLPTKSRRETLLETYSFTCGCSSCSKPHAVDPREALWCPQRCGGLCALPDDPESPAQCSKCSTKVSDVPAVLDLVRVGTEGLDKASGLQSSDSSQAIRLTSNLIPLLDSADFHPAAHPLLALTRLHQSLLIDTFPDAEISQELLDEVIRTAMRNVTGLTSILHYGHPVRAIAISEMGKVLSMDESSPRHTSPEYGIVKPGEVPSGPARLKLAYDTLIRALGELSIGFGKADQGGEVGREMKQVVVQLEKELEVWGHGVKNVRSDHRKAA